LKLEVKWRTNTKYRGKRSRRDWAKENSYTEKSGSETIADKCG